MLLKPYYKWVLTSALVILVLSAFSPPMTEPPLQEEGGGYGPTLSRILDTGVLRVGVKENAAPFCSQQGGDWSGFDIALIKDMVELWNKQWQFNIQYEFIPEDTSRLIPRLQVGDFDLVICAITHTKSRDELIDFSQTYFLDGQSLLVRKGSGVTGLDATLAGRTVACLEGSTACDNLEKQSQTVGFTVKPFAEQFQVIPALTAGQIDAYIRDFGILWDLARDSSTFELVGKRFTDEPYAIGLPSNDSQFRDLVNYSLQVLKRNGTYDLRYRTWLDEKTTIPYKPQTFQAEWTAVMTTTPSFPSTLEKLKAGEPIIAGVREDICPLSCWDQEQGKFVGFEIDLLNELGRRWSSKIEFKGIDSPERLQAIKEGIVDIGVFALTQTNKRDEEVDFSQTYFLDGQSLLVCENSGIQSIQDLQGKTVACIKDTTSCENIRKKSNELGIDLEAVQEVQGYIPGLLQCDRGSEVAAFTGDSSFLLKTATDNPELSVVGGLFSEEPYGMGVRQNDSAFRDLVNSTLQEMKKDGTYDTLFSNWLPNTYTPYDIEIWPDGQLAAPGQYGGVNFKNPDCLPANNECQVVTQAGGEPPADNAGIYVVQVNDTLGAIAQRCYGDIFKYQMIFEDSRARTPELVDPNLIEAGMELMIYKNRRPDFQNCKLVGE